MTYCNTCACELVDESLLVIHAKAKHDVGLTYQEFLEAKMPRAKSFGKGSLNICSCFANGGRKRKTRSRLFIRVMSSRLSRRFIGIELKKEFWQQACAHLDARDLQASFTDNPQFTELQFAGADQ